ncbi:MAG: HEPN domain-containing protein [Phycisphaerales bacterium]|nr:HEPN domain-containing protein [Phycisphaerales bacterium]
MPGAAEEWIAKAEGDMHVAEREFHRADDQNFDAVCFHVHQCVEKLMKAVLITHGIAPEYTHNLVYLDAALQKVAPWISDPDELNGLKRAGVAFWYPGEWATHAHASRAMSIGQRLREALLRMLNERSA